MDKIKCYKLIEPGKRSGYIGHIIPTGRPKQSAIIMIAGGTVEATEAALIIAISEAPDKYKATYDLEQLEP